jgi:hypothetical protein
MIQTTNGKILLPSVLASNMNFNRNMMRKIQKN